MVVRRPDEKGNKGPLPVQEFYMKETFGSPKVRASTSYTCDGPSRPRRKKYKEFIERLHTRCVVCSVLLLQYVILTSVGVCDGSDSDIRTTNILMQDTCIQLQGLL